MLRRTTLSGSNPTRMKSQNMRAVLMAFLRHGELSRARLAELTGLSSTTITNLVAEMAAAGLVTELASPQNGSRSVGRPRTPLRLRPEAGHAVGVHVSVGHIRIALTDLCGRIVADRALRHDLTTPAETVLAETARQIEALLAAHAAPPDSIVGVGVGASGLVNPQSGVNVLAPNLGWRNVAIRDLLEQRLGLPVVVDNNVRAMALAEARFGAGRDAEVMAFIYARIGVGAGIIVGQQLFRGSGAGAGEIGHITILPDGGEPCRCGNHGCLETLVSEPAILRLAAEVAAQAPDGLLAQHLRQATAEETRLAAVFAAARGAGPEQRVPGLRRLGVPVLLDDAARRRGVHGRRLALHGRRLQALVRRGHLHALPGRLHHRRRLLPVRSEEPAEPLRGVHEWQRRRLDRPALRDGVRRRWRSLHRLLVSGAPGVPQLHEGDDPRPV